MAVEVAAYTDQQAFIDAFIEDAKATAAGDPNATPISDSQLRADAIRIWNAHWNEGGGSFNSDSPLDFEILKQHVAKLPNMNQALATDFVNQFGEEWNGRNGSYPSYWEALASGDFQNAVQWLPFSEVLPPAFNYGDGVYTYKPTTGPIPISPANTVAPSALDSEGMTAGAVGDASAGLPFDDRKDEGGGNIGTAKPFSSFPTITPQALAAAVQQRGSGSGRSSAVFDKDQLTEQAAEMWRSYLLEPPPDTLRQMVDEYARKANSFWLGKGGRLDFETFMLGKVRGTSRYSELYRHKTGDVTERQYISQFVQSAGSVGLGADQTNEVAARGAIAGASPTGTAQLAADTPSYQRSGSFARSLANTIVQLGRGATAA